jgi:hypothetical protein
MSSTNQSAALSLPDPEVHHEFRVLTMVLTLLTAVNNNGHPSFRETSGVPLTGPLERGTPHEKLTLEATAAILVRDTEIVTATTCRPSVDDLSTSLPSLPDEDREDSEHPKNPIHLLAVQEDLFFEFTSKEFDDINMAEIATISNPDQRDEHSFSSGGGEDFQCILVSPGMSHWSKIKDDSWFGIQLPYVSIDTFCL